MGGRKHKSVVDAVMALIHDIEASDTSHLKNTPTVFLNNHLSESYKNRIYQFLLLNYPLTLPLNP
jgi:hypothetical protein